jgi:hypothetical protein
MKITTIGIDLAKRIYRPGFAYKKTGVMLVGIAAANMCQLSLLPQHGAGDKSERLMDAMDKLNQAYGRNTLSVFSTGDRKSWPCAGKTCRPAIPLAGAMYRSHTRIDPDSSCAEPT